MMRYNWGSLTEISLPATEPYCYLTTTGRRTGSAHTVELWFAAEPGSSTIYILAGGGYRADWVKNLGTNPNAEVRIGTVTFGGTGRIVQEPEEEQLARRLIVSKYYGRKEVRSSGWEAEALPVAIDLELTKSN
jgi:deazaflavin-dependent oxidoreductase (nitroreductase family)